MTTEFIVYGLVDPITHQLRYIGKSQRGLLRPSQHTMRSYLKKDKTRKARWIRGLLKENIKPEIVIIQELPTKEGLSEAEIFWIAYFKTMGCPLTNHCRGGEGFTGSHREDSKKKIGAYWKGKKRGPQKTEALQKFLATKGCRPFNDQHGNTYRTITEAAQKLGLSKGNIHSVLHRHQNYKHVGGFVFRYIDDVQDFSIGSKKPDPKQRPIKDQNGVIYESQCDAARKLGLWQTNISKVLLGKTKTTGGYSFTYI